MDIEAELELAKRLITAQSDKPLDHLPLNILRGSLEGKSLSKIAESYPCSENYTKEVSSKLCKSLSVSLGKRVTKKNLRPLLAEYLQLEKQNSEIVISPVPQIVATPAVVNPEFIGSALFDLLGRDADRQKLTELSQKHKLVLLKAGAGIGKSTLARHFLETQFTKVIRLEMGLEAGNVTPAEEKVSQILRKEFDEEPSRDFQTNLEILREKLSDKLRPIGVLIDNLEPALDGNFRFLEKLRGYEDLLRILGDRDVCSFTLITSRLDLIVQRVKAHEYSLQGLDIEAWREYFHDCENGETSEALEQMCVAYNGNAKVMDILHGAITNRFGGNIAAYWNRYKDALLADAELETLISVEMDWLRDNQPDAYKLLCRMGCYRYQDVKTVPFEGLICLLWDVPEARQTWVVDYLSKSSLIEIKGEYYLHPAIRYACNYQLLENPSEWEATNLIVADFWTECVKTIESGDDALRAFESYHHYKLTDKKNLAGEVLVYERKNLWAENSPLGASLYRLGWLDTLISSITDIMSSIEPNYTLSRLNNILGDTYWMTGKIHQAILHHHQSREVAVIYRKENFDLPQNIKSRLRRCEVASVLNIGLCKIDLWELEKAIDLLEEIVEIAIPEHDEDYYFYEPINNAFFCLAFLYSELHFFDKANKFIERSKKITNIKTQTEWARGNRLIFLGHAYKNIGLLDCAIDSFERTLNFAKDSNYPQSKGKALVGLATTLRVRTNPSDVISLYYEAIDTLKPIGAKCDLAEAYFQIGLTYHAMGENDQAETYKAKALELFEQIEAPKQIDRVNQAFEQGAKQ